MSTLLRQSVTGLGSVQRTEPQTQVRTEEEVTVETSLSVVNELTVSGVSVVAYLRGFFPEDNFVDKRIFPVARLTNSASQPSQSQSQSQPGLTSLKVKTLNKGASKEGDEFIRFLEGGVAEAINKGYLKSLILAIYTNQNEPQNILEGWSFDYAYSTDSSGKVDPSLTVHDHSGNLVAGHNSISPTSIESIKLESHKLLKSIMKTAQQLKQLPRRRLLNFRLVYTDNAPDHWHPQGFHDAEHPTAAELVVRTSSVDDRPDKDKFGQVSTAHHSVSIQMVSVANSVTKDKHEDSLSPAECRAIAERESKKRKVEWTGEMQQPAGVRNSMGDLIGLDAVEIESHYSSLRRQVGLGTIPPATQLVCGNEFDEFDETAPSSVDAVALARQNKALLGHEGSTQFPQTQRFDRLDGKLRVGGTSIADSSAEDEGPLRIRGGQGSDDETDGNEERREGEVDTVMAEADADIKPVVAVSPPPPTQPPPSHVSATSITSNKSSTIRLGEDGEKYGCECQAVSHGDDLACDECKNWFHQWCYGYGWTDDVAFPFEMRFECWTCQAERLRDGADATRLDEIESALKQLSELAVIRRLMAQAFDHGVGTPAEFAETLDLDLNVVEKGLAKLEEDKFIITQKKRARIKPKSSEPEPDTAQEGAKKYNKTSAMERLRQREWFNPTKGCEGRLLAKLRGEQVVEQKVKPRARKATFASSSHQPPTPPEDNEVDPLDEADLLSLKSDDFDAFDATAEDEDSADNFSDGHKKKKTKGTAKKKPAASKKKTKAGATDSSSPHKRKASAAGGTRANKAKTESKPTVKLPGPKGKSKKPLQDNNGQDDAEQDEQSDAEVDLKSQRELEDEAKAAKGRGKSKGKAASKDAEAQPTKGKAAGSKKKAEVSAEAKPLFVPKFGAAKKKAASTVSASGGGASKPKTGGGVFKAPLLAAKTSASSTVSSSKKAEGRKAAKDNAPAEAGLQDEAEEEEKQDEAEMEDDFVERSDRGNEEGDGEAEGGEDKDKGE